MANQVNEKLLKITKIVTQATYSCAKPNLQDLTFFLCCGHTLFSPLLQHDLLCFFKTLPLV